jgi:hypothetical protein
MKRTFEFSSHTSALSTQNLAQNTYYYPDGPRTCLLSDLDWLVASWVDMFDEGVCIEWVNVKSGEGGEYEEYDEKGVVVVVGSSAHEATLWWMIVLLSPRTISIPNS